MEIAPVADLDELSARVEQVEGLVVPPFSEEDRLRGTATGSRAGRRMAWHRSVEDTVLDLSSAVPEGLADYDVRKLLEFVAHLRRLLEADPDVQDATGEIEVVTMQTADVARRIRRRLLHQQLDEPEVAIGSILKTLSNIGAAEIAGLLGVSTRTVGAWRHGSTVKQNAARVVLVAQLLTYLRASMTPRGMMMWFHASRAQLDGLTPLQLLDQDAATAHAVLLGLARGARGQLAD